MNELKVMNRFSLTLIFGGLAKFVKTFQFGSHLTKIVNIFH
jgi:hypothetical protein